MQRTIIITGSTDGIGKLTAIELAKEGDEIYLHGRNPEKLNATIAEVKESSNNDNIKGFLADFADLDSVKQMADQIKENISKIDVLINNAGIYKSYVSQNKDGINIQLTVNYLAPYLLTKELIPLMQKGTEPRIVNLSSAAQSPVSLEAIKGKSQLGVNDAYAQSKLALTMWSFNLAKQLNDISVVAVNPGSLLNTKMAHEAYGQHWSPAEKGSNIIHELAVSEKYNNVTGKYFDNDQGSFNDAHPDAYDELKIENLMNITNKILAKID